MVPRPSCSLRNLAAGLKTRAQMRVLSAITDTDEPDVVGLCALEWWANLEAGEILGAAVLADVGPTIRARTKNLLLLEPADLAESAVTLSVEPTRLYDYSIYSKAAVVSAVQLFERVPCMGVLGHRTVRSPVIANVCMVSLQH